MYLHNVPAVNYLDPWNIPLEKRLKALESGHRRVAYIYLLPDYFVFRYRVYNMVQALQESSDGTSAAYFTDHDLSVMDKVVDMADVIVICRTKYDQELNRIITRARGKGKIVYFDIDDLVFDTRYIHLILNSNDLERNEPVTWDNWFAHLGRINATMQLCDRAITTNGYLAERLQAHFNEKVSVIPNFLNREQMKISGQIYEQKRASGFSHTDKIHLGYFSGTPTHNNDFNVAADALTSIMENRPDVILRLVGPMVIRGPLQNFSDRIERYPLQDFLNLQRSIGQVEINLIPLQDNEFTNCKSELKYFEAGITGTVSLATPTFSFSRAIRDGKNGFLARSFEWYEKLQRLLDMVWDSTWMEIAENAVLDSELRYAWYKQTQLIETTLFAPSKSPAHLQPSQAIQVAREEPVENNDSIDQAETLQLALLKNTKLQNKVKEQEKALQSLEMELAEIYGSYAWKVLGIYRKIKIKMFPPGSLQEMPLRVLRAFAQSPRQAIKLAITKSKQLFMQPRRKVIKAQDKRLIQSFSVDTERLIVFLVPGVDVVNGGTMSICSLAKVSHILQSVHNSVVLIATLPGSQLISKFTHFENPFDIYRFEQLPSYFLGLKELTIHIPEAFVPQFVARLSKTEKGYLGNIPKLQINILNQNVWLMPSREIITQLKEFTDLVTCTTAHARYCTQQAREYYGIPYHNFSASNLTNYYFLPYKDKENLMIISHDPHKYKNKILTRLKREHPEITIKKIEKVPYEEYKHLLERAKWAITFGEGLDGYFVESIRSGAIPFAVYNKDFFTDRFKDLPNVYLSYEEMYNNISTDIDKLSSPSLFERLSKQLIDLDKQEYNDEEYKENIRRFYAGDYDLP